MNINQDSLDYEKQQYTRARSGYSQNKSTFQVHNQNQIMKQLYKQQLDDLVKQKEGQKKIQKEQEAKEKMLYNQRINFSMEAQKLKDASYKNYYQVLLNNQANISKNYVDAFIDRDVYKNQLISQRMENEKKRSQAWHQLQQKRLMEMKKSYREQLANQINEKYQKNTIEGEYKNHEKQQYKKLTYNPKDLAVIERQRKLIQMQKYKEDLDRNANKGSRVRDRSLPHNSSPIIANDFNISKIQDRHNPMINPLPYNIQNPYILKEMMRRQSPQANQYEIMNHN